MWTGAHRGQRRVLEWKALFTAELSLQSFHYIHKNMNTYVVNILTLCIY